MLEITPEFIAVGISLAIGFYTAYQRYQRTGSLRLKTLPWRAFRRFIYELRATYFTREKPDNASVTVDRDLEVIRETLGRQSYAPAWLLSYRYFSEDANLRHYYLDPGREYPHRQIHVRCFQHDDSVELLCHEEPAPDYHPIAHLKATDQQTANSWVLETLRGGQRGGR